MPQGTERQAAQSKPTRTSDFNRARAPGTTEVSQDALLLLQTVRQDGHPTCAVTVSEAADEGTLKLG